MEEKTSKKSIYLMLVGALTLLVLVSTATFAYFQISVNGSSTNTTLNTNVESGIGIFQILGGGESLGLHLTIDNMDNTDSARHAYEATTTGGATKAHVGTLSKTAANLGRTYTCYFDVVATSSGTKMNEINESDNSKFIISSVSPNVTFSDDNGSTYKSTIEKPWTDLSSQQTYKGKWVSGLDDAENAFVDVQASIENINGNQKHLAGLNGSLNFKLQSMTCTSASNVTATRGNSPIKVTLSNVTNESTLRTNLPSELTNEQKESAKLVEVTVPSGSGSVTITIDVSGFASEGETVVLYHYNGSSYDSEQTQTVTDGKVTGIFSSLSSIALVNKGKKESPYKLLNNLKTNAPCNSPLEGCEVAIGNEHFYVLEDAYVENNVTKVKLLAKYNLNVGNNPWGGTATGIQDEHCKGYVSSGGTYYCTVAYHDSSYVPVSSITKDFKNNVMFLDSNNNMNMNSVNKRNYEIELLWAITDPAPDYSAASIRYYVNNYVEYLEEVPGVEIENGTLLTHEEMDVINASGHWYQNNNVPKTSFWSSSPNVGSYVWNLFSDGLLREDSFFVANLFGVRPVILVDWS